MNIYFEISKNSVHRFLGQYFVEHNVPSTGVTRFNLQLMQHADRAWVEDSQNIWYIKNRKGLTKPDLEEFLCIKLKCKPYR